MRQTHLSLCLGVLLSLALGCASRMSQQPPVFAVIAMDIHPEHEHLKRTTAVLVNQSEHAIFIPSMKFTRFFQDSIEFEMKTAPRNKVVTLPLKQPDTTHVDPSEYELKPGQSACCTLYWHDTMNDHFYATLADAREVRLRWWYQYTVDGQRHYASAISPWMPIETFRKLPRTKYQLQKSHD